MTQLDAILTQLPGWVGTARQLAERAARDPRDSTFKRALTQATEDGLVFRSGEVFHPLHVAGGFGAAAGLGIHEGAERTGAFSQMSAVAGMYIGSGNPEKVTTRHKRADGTLAPALEHFGLRLKES